MLIKILSLFVLLLATVFSFDEVARYYSNIDKVESLNSAIDKELYRQKQNLLVQADVISINWLHTLNPLVKKVQGNVTWSSSKQAGIASFSGLPKTTDVQSYQLWVYDLESTYNEPISLARFKVARKKTIVINAHPDTIVKQPYKFELVLEDNKNSNIRKLLLAQP